MVTCGEIQKAHCKFFDSRICTHIFEWLHFYCKLYKIDICLGIGLVSDFYRIFAKFWLNCANTNAKYRSRYLYCLYVHSFSVDI